MIYKIEWKTAYSCNLPMVSKEDYETYWLGYYTEGNKILLNQNIVEIENRINQCEGGRRIDIITEEIEHLGEVQKKSSEHSRWYAFRKRRNDTQVLKKIACRELQRYQVDYYIGGAVAYDLTNYLKDRLKEEQEANISFENIPGGKNGNALGKLILIKETDMYDAVKKLCVNKNKEFVKKRAAELLAEITGEKANYIESVLPKLDTFYAEKKNNPYTETSVVWTKNTLSNVGLPTERLENILKKLQQD